MPPSSLALLRPAGSQDALCLGVLATQVFLDTYATEGIREAIAREALEHCSTEATTARLADARTHFIVAEQDGHLLGFVELRFGDAPVPMPAGPAAQVVRLYVLERFTGRGLGTLLLAQAEELAAAGGANRVWLTAWVGNARARAVYPRRGYDDAGTTHYEFGGDRYENRLFAKPVIPLAQRHINPDHFLDTPQGRLTTPERNALAWQQCRAALDAALRTAAPGATLCLMIGAQGSGKSCWARRHVASERDAIVFDAILVQRFERAPLLAAAAHHGVPAVAVWCRTPLALCLARNAARPADEIADEQGLRNVFAALQPPSLDEGFERVVEVGLDAA
jgi:diamine N-acetyltransferase